MKKSMMRRSLFRSIRRSLTRYVAIVAIIALGAGIFVGLRTTKSDMIATGQKYMDEQNMFDLRLLSTYGWDRSDVDKVSALDGVEDAEGVISMDVIATMTDSDTESVYKVYSIPERINRVYLHGGRMPSAPNECLADGFHIGDEILGKKIAISSVNEQDVIDSFHEHTFTVVGYVSTPIYMDMSRGNTPLGNGTVSSFLYIPEESFALDYYTEIAVTLPGESTIYSASYEDFIDNESSRLEELIKPITQGRFDNLLIDAEKEYSDGKKQYDEGLADYQAEKKDALAELASAKKQLEENQKQLDDNKKLLDDGEKQLIAAQKLLDDGKKQIDDSRAVLAEKKAEAYAQLAENYSMLTGQMAEVNGQLAKVEDGLKQIENGLSQIDSGIFQIELGISTIETSVAITEPMLRLAKTGLNAADAALQEALDEGADAATVEALREQVKELKLLVEQYEQEVSALNDQLSELSDQLLQLQNQRAALVAQKESTQSAKEALLDAQAQVTDGLAQLDTARKQAELEFQSAEAQLEAAEAEMKKAQNELDSQAKALEENKKVLQEGEDALKKGWQDYYSAEKEAQEQLDSAWQELEDARLKLEDARKAIDAMSDPELYLLGRDTNMGYIALDSNSDIVEGVSTVFPAFFLLIAALVCITTMTRMVEEERTQIGTLKALGYNNRAIIGKYLKYAGSAAVIGCGVGVIVGSVVFPLILWEAYQILMFLGDYYLLRMDWLLCFLVVFAYTGITLLVTWYCCRRSLREVPAQLIRPKPPTTGKKIFLEYLPFWKRFSFLNKVMLRNIFRYRQRLFMMIIGIGGCTALLLTGFGLRDSVGDLASYHFGEIYLHDIEIRFKEHQGVSDREQFCEDYQNSYSDVMFYHQSSVELQYDGKIKDVTFLAAGSDLSRFIDFHSGKNKISMPGKNEAIVSIGVAELMNISVGDRITVRDSNMRSLELNVSGIFDNHVYNYVITPPETVLDQWGEAAPVQMACLYVAQGQDVHQVGADISTNDKVMNVTVNKDVEKQVSKMLEALDLIVITVVICAALLAIIVLYNLTNINITERLREIATIKVLGFHSTESAAYVFKENLVLSVMGACLGLFGGIYLLDFVMSKIQVDMVWIATRLDAISYILAIVITMVSALAVDFILYFKLEKVNMAEALKTVE